MRKPVTPRIEDAPGMTTCVTVPGLVTTVTGRNAPAVLGISAGTAHITAWYTAGLRERTRGIEGASDHRR